MLVRLSRQSVVFTLALASFLLYSVQCGLLRVCSELQKPVDVPSFWHVSCTWDKDWSERQPWDRHLHPEGADCVDSGIQWRWLVVEEALCVSDWDAVRQINDTRRASAPSYSNLGPHGRLSVGLSSLGRLPDFVELAFLGLTQGCRGRGLARARQHRQHLTSESAGPI